MPITRRTMLTAAAATSLAAGVARAQDGAPVVDTAGGKLRGSSSGGVLVFKGIPYAASTAGANRFRPPQPVAAAAGVRDATAFGASAPQLPASGDPLGAWYGKLEALSEDCLSLNVFTPGTAGKRPVMVWLHGGAWVSCAGSAPGFDGTVLARDGDVVVVTINHRLNVFGYVALDEPGEDDAQSGNAGVLDMVAALRWVRDNAAAFGGDPANVTIFGQSGGGAKVSAMLALPAAQGLFHKAIAQSCSGSLVLASPEEAAANARALATRLGIGKPTAAAMRAVPMEQLIAGQRGLPPVFRPVHDGHVFPANPFEPGAPPQAHDVPTLFGNAATETRLYMAANMANFSLDAAEVQKRLARFMQIDAAHAGRVMAAYAGDMTGASPSDILGAVTTDYGYRRNTTLEAARQAAAAGAPVYAYVYDWRTPVRDGLLQSPHTIEVPFVFGTAPAAAALVGTGPDLPRLTALTVATWAAFAHTGNPSNPHIPAWPRYDAAGKATMLLSLDSKVASDPGGERRRALEGIPLFQYNMPINYPQA